MNADVCARHSRMCPAKDECQTAEAAARTETVHRPPGPLLRRFFAPVAFSQAWAFLRPLWNDFPPGTPTSSDETHLAQLLQLREDLLDELRADRRQLSCKVAQRELFHLREGGMPHQSALGGTCIHGLYLSFELFVGAAQHAEKVVPPWGDLVLALVPSPRAFGQDAVVVFLALLDKALQADVPRYLEAVGLEQERRGKSGNPAVSVTARMDAQKIEHEGGDDQKRREPFVIAGLSVVPAKRVHGFRRILGGCGDEPDFPLAVGQDFDDLVLPFLPFPGIAGKAALGEGVNVPAQFPIPIGKAFIPVLGSRFPV